MNPADLIPTADAIPVPWGWFQVLLIATFTIHLLFMNAMVGGGIIALAGHIKGNPSSEPVRRDLSGRLTIIIALAVNFGVAPLLFLQALYGQFIYVSSQLMAVYWLSVIGILILAYYGAYLYKFKYDVLMDKRVPLLGVTVVLLLAIAFFFTNNMTLMLRPEAWIRYFENPQGTILNLSDPTLIPRYLHFMTASVAVGGLFIALVWTYRENRGTPGAREHIDQGMRWFTHATLLQIVIGFWFQMSLPREIMLLFMGKSPVHTGLFLVALALVVAVLLLGIHRKVRLTAGATLALVLLMVVMRDLVRAAYLSPYYTPSDLAVTGQYSPLAVFLAALVVCSGVIFWVVREAWRVAE